MKVAEAARRLEVSPSLIYSLIAAGKLGCYRIGHGRGSIRISEEHIAGFLASVEQGKEAPIATTTPNPPRPPLTLKHLRVRR